MHSLGFVILCWFALHPLNFQWYNLVLKSCFHTAKAALSWLRCLLKTSALFNLDYLFVLKFCLIDPVRFALSLLLALWFDSHTIISFLKFLWLVAHSTCCTFWHQYFSPILFSRTPWLSTRSGVSPQSRSWFKHLVSAHCSKVTLFYSGMISPLPSFLKAALSSCGLEACRCSSHSLLWHCSLCCCLKGILHPHRWTLLH